MRTRINRLKREEEGQHDLLSNGQLLIFSVIDFGGNVDVLSCSQNASFISEEYALFSESLQAKGLKAESV